jgi:hypothetical protein
MMYKTRIRLVVLAGSILMLLSACNSGLTEPAGKNGADGTVVLTVQVQGIEARSLLPIFSQADISAYELWGGTGEVEDKLLEFTNPSAASVAVAPDIWNFTLKAYKGADLILQGTITGRVIPSASNALAFSLVPLKEGTGAVKITITLPPNSGITQAAVIKDESSLPTVTAAGNSIVYETSLSAGDYLYTFKLQDSTGANIVVITEAVAVRSNVPTEAAITLSAEDLNFLAMAPAGLTAASQSDGSIKLQWNALAMAKTYRVYRSTTDTFGTNFTPVTSGTTYTDSTASTPGETYYYRVFAINDAEEESRYAAVSMKVIELSAIMPLSGNVVLTWDTESSAAKYTVSRAVGALGAYIPIGTINAPAFSYTDTGVRSGIAYSYRVSALNSGDKETAFSQAVPATPIASTLGISAFSFASPAVNGIISGTDITLTAPNIVNLSVLSPTITLTESAISVSPASGTPQDFTGPVTYQVMATDGSTRDYTVTVNVTSRTLAEALTWLNTNAVNNAEYTIVPLQNEVISPTSLSYTDKTVAIILKGGAEEKIISLDSNGSLFTIGSGTTLTLDNNITLQGRSNNASLVSVSTGGILVMKDGAEITGNTSSYSYGGGVYSSGTFTMSGGTISGNTSSASYNYSYGGGVYISGGTFTKAATIGCSINSNTINPTSTNRGNQVYVYSGSKYRNADAGDTVALDSAKSGSGGGW